MTNRKWVLLLHVFTRSFHQSCWIAWPTVCEWHCFILVPGMLINHVASHDQQQVSDTASFVSMHSHQSCCIPWLTASEWHCFMCSPGILINHAASHDQQHVSHIASFVCQAVSLIISDPMTNRKCVLHLFARQSPQSCCISWPTASEWHCIICLPGRLMLHPMTNSEWVTLLHLFARQAHQSCCIPWPTVSEWNCFISLPGRLMHHVASHDQQRVSDTASCVYQAGSSIMLHAMTNSLWVTLRLLHSRNVVKRSKGSVVPPT